MCNAHARRSFRQHVDPGAAGLSGAPFLTYGLVLSVALWGVVAVVAVANRGHRKGAANISHSNRTRNRVPRLSRTNWALC